MSGIVNDLVWEYHPAGTLASDNIGNSYIIDTRGKGIRFIKWPQGFAPEVDTLEAAKAAAQADYEARVLSALTADPRAMVAAALERAASVARDALHRHAKRAYTYGDVGISSQSAAKTYCAGEILEEIRALIDTDHAAALEAVKAEAYRQGQEDERAACATPTKTYAAYGNDRTDRYAQGFCAGVENQLAAIRARGESE